MRFIPHQDMKIIARQGEDTYLVQTSDAEARVLHLADGIMYPFMLIESIAAHTHGYWEAYDGTAEELAELLKRVWRPATWAEYPSVGPVFNRLAWGILATTRSTSPT